MSKTLQFKRGLVANLPTLLEGEPAVATDTKDLYVGDSTGIPFKVGELRQVFNVQTKTVNYTASNFDCILANGTVTITLTTEENAWIKIKNIGTGLITVNTTSGTIDGFTSHTITAQYSAFDYVCDGTNWYLV